MMSQNVEAAVVLGFDSVVGLFERMLMLWDAKTLARVTGSFYDIVDDGHGNSWYMYRGPAFKTKGTTRRGPISPTWTTSPTQTYRFFTKIVKGNTGIKSASWDRRPSASTRRCSGRSVSSGCRSSSGESRR